MDGRSLYVHRKLKIRSGISRTDITNCGLRSLHNIEDRLACWLLTCHGRMETHRLALTHNFLGEMLAHCGSL
jgi:hypothetical protein